MCSGVKVEFLSGLNPILPPLPPLAPDGTIHPVPPRRERHSRAGLTYVHKDVEFSRRAGGTTALDLEASESRNAVHSPAFLAG